MPFIPHTETDLAAMLATIGVKSLDELFDEIPQELRSTDFSAIPPGLSELEVTQLLETRARQDQPATCFIGAGTYDHHIPAAVWQIVSRGEFYSAYTPYQAEASQGTLQVLYEFQSMMSALTGLAFSNASLYDGASALAEAVLMTVRLKRRAAVQKILVPRALHPAYRQTLKTLTSAQQIELIEIPFDLQTGQINLNNLEKIINNQDFTALIINQPNFFGVLEDPIKLTNWAHSHNALVIAVVNPLSLSILTPPSEWGETGADLACGEAQPFGMPLAAGGPYAGFLCCKAEYVRQLPGRIVGRTQDLAGQTGFTLTLQAREQHIRRGKATSNICTNQGLMVTAATIYLALLGAAGLEQIAITCHTNTKKLTDLLSALPGVQPLFDQFIFHEQVLRLPRATDVILEQLATRGIWGGYNLDLEYPELAPAVLICATERRTAEELQEYTNQLANILNN